MTSTYASVTREIAGHTITLETGQMARQALGSVIATVDGTKCFAAVCAGPGREDQDFFPLTVDYREKTEAAGKIPGGFFKREGRPTTKEILTMRLIDRAIRPLFADGFKQEVQLMSHCLCYDGVTNSDVTAMIAGFAAVRISGMPFHGSLGAVRVGQIDGKFVAFPSDEERRTNSALDLVVAGHADAVCMVEASAKQLKEREMVDALEFAHDVIRQIAELIDELNAKVGKPAYPWTPPTVDEALAKSVSAYRPRVKDVLFTPGKHDRADAIDAIRDEAVAALVAGITDEKELAKRTKAAKGAFDELASSVEREAIVDGKRADGRAFDQIREITIVPNFIPRQHGSVLFTRGETQALVSVTLGTADDEQIIDGLDDEYRKNFYLHYNFPPYSVGETRRIMGPGRREIGHGMLAERALGNVTPPKDRFPYTIRIVSDIMESNGSSSMASVCGGCLAMMLAGVPLMQPVAGIAMGLVEEGGKQAVLSDILGSEDHHGDMDFKVAGSGLGITALQMDIKIKGVTRELLERALEQARRGRIEILKKMLDAVPRPAKEISPYAPRMEVIRIPSDKIGYLIGPGGRNIKAMQEQYKVKIAILDDTGTVQVAGVERDNVAACIQAIQAMCETPKIGTRYKGTVKSIKDFGAFIEILPGVEGLCHISELDEGYVDRVTDIVQIGEEVEVEIINVDDRGKIKLSRKAVLVGSGAGPEEPEGDVNEGQPNDE
ncbi:MAG: polyribonucleotide nucleotidyltransferase [Planctomycetes bacterium]|nr:polyribonucleotide nucleotidyltransferase [Planctomycetota bacterium]